MKSFGGINEGERYFTEEAVYVRVVNHSMMERWGVQTPAVETLNIPPFA